MFRILLLALFSAALFSAAAQAAPDRISLEYEVIRNGLRLGTVTDTFTRNGNQYLLVSETRAADGFRIFMPGIVRFESRGNVTTEGLQPLQFQHIRSDAPNKLATATFDWDKHQVRHQYKGNSKLHENLLAGSQDQLSVLYQFAFMSPLPAEYELEVASGKSIKKHRYLGSDGGVVATPAGPFATRLYQRVGHAADDKSVSVWIAPARHNLPVQVSISQDGVTVEQRLVRYRVGE
jgi:hypothetical protein